MPPPSPATPEAWRLTLHPSLAFTLPSYLSQSLPLLLPISLESRIIPGCLAILVSFWIARPCNPPQPLLVTSSLLILSSSLGSSSLGSTVPSWVPSPCTVPRGHCSVLKTPSLLLIHPCPWHFKPVFALCELPISEYSLAQHQVEREKMEQLGRC